MTENGTRGGAVADRIVAQPRHLSCLPLAALTILIALKVGLLLAFGPTMLPDSGGYIAYADAILDGSFRHVDLAGSVSAGNSDSHYRLSGFDRGSKNHRRPVLGMGCHSVPVRGFDLRNGFALSIGPDIPAWRLAEPFRRGGASDRNAVCGRSIGADRQSLRKYHDDRGMHSGNDCAAASARRLVVVFRRRPFVRCRFPGTQRDRVHGGGLLPAHRRRSQGGADAASALDRRRSVITSCHRNPSRLHGMESRARRCSRRHHHCAGGAIRRASRSGGL